MSTKRGREEMEVAEVQGLSSDWTFLAGISVQEAIAHVAREKGRDAKALVIEDLRDKGTPVVLPQTECLRPENRYRIRFAKLRTPVQRRFGAGVSVVSDLHYYVQPEIGALLQDLRLGKYCALCGPRQSGKTTSVLAAQEHLSDEPDAATVVYLGGFTSADASWDRHSLWCYFWDSLRLRCPQLFGTRNPEEFCGELQILKLFSIENLQSRVTVVLDEADTLFRLSPTCIDEFFHVMRLMKNEPHSFNLHGFVLVGTERLRDLLEGHSYQRIAEAEAKGEAYIGGSTPSMLSPFPHDHVLKSTKFSLEDVNALLSQAAADRPGVGIDVEAIAESIMQWTWGHKGLTGTCLAYLVQEELWKLKAWIDHAESYRLGTYIFGQATYSRVMQYLRVHVHIEDISKMLVTILEVGEALCESESVVVGLRDFIAEGVLSVIEKENGDRAVTLSSPLLRTAMLRGCAIRGADVDSPPNPTRLDRRWVLLEAIRSLDGGAMCRPEVLNARGELSEYSYQFLLMCRVKAVISHAYPTVGARVLPEAKEVRVPSSKRSQLQLDTLVRDGDNFSKFGFELVVSGSARVIREHLERAVKYQHLHSAQIFVINFISNKSEEELVCPQHDSVFFLSVFFNVQNSVVEVTFVDVHGTIEVVSLPLKRWNGILSLAEL